MPQHDYDLANQNGAAFRADLNNALLAIVQQNSGATAPSVTFPYQFWADTSAGILKQRNAANSAWIDILTLSSGEGIALKTHAATEKTSLADDDEFAIVDSAASNALKRVKKSTLAAELIGAFSNNTFRNRLVNPDGAIYQRAIAATADDTYFADRWYMLTQTGTVTPSQLTDPEDGYPDGIRITQSQVTAQRFGYAQILRGDYCKDLRGNSGTFVPRVRISNAQAIRYAILGWTGTENAVTSDVVNDWTSSTYTAGNFFISTTLSVLGVGSMTPTANTWTSLTALTASLGSAFNNLIVMVWTEGTAAQNVTLDFDFHQFEPGVTASDFDRVSPQENLSRCQEFVLKSYNVDVAPATVTEVGVVSCTNGSLSGNTQAINFPVTMWGTPDTITLYSPVSGTSARVRNESTGADETVTTSLVGANGFRAYGTSTTSGVAFRFHYLAVKEL